MTGRQPPTPAEIAQVRATADAVIAELRAAEARREAARRRHLRLLPGPRWLSREQLTTLYAKAGLAAPQPKERPNAPA